MNKYFLWIVILGIIFGISGYFYYQSVIKENLKIKVTTPKPIDNNSPKNTSTKTTITNVNKSDMENIKRVTLNGRTTIGEGAIWKFSLDSLGNFSGESFGWPMTEPDKYAVKILGADTDLYFSKISQIIKKYDLEKNGDSEETEVFIGTSNRYTLSGFGPKDIFVFETNSAFKELGEAVSLIESNVQDPETKQFIIMMSKQ